MSEVKPLIHGLCSVNLFEMSEKSEEKIKKLKYFFYHLSEKPCELTRYVLLYEQGCFWFLFIPVIKSSH